MHLVSVIVPTYNRAKSIIKCLSSIVNQTYNNLELIIIDDGSADNSEEIINNFIESYKGEKKIYYYRQENQGASIARNYGFSKSKGDFIVFFDSDDEMLPFRIEYQIKAIEQKNANCCAAGFA